MRLPFELHYARLPARFFERVRPTPVRAPALLALNAPLAASLGLDPAVLASPEGVAALAGNLVPEGAEPIALAYAGHQFGGFVPRLGDGRAILLGELSGPDGVPREVQLKGAGPTPFSRGGDGRAALGPVLREYLVSEAMHALGVPTTRALAAVRTGEAVLREEALPGAVLTRVATSHLRVGTFQYFAAREDTDALARLVDFALTRHHPRALADAGDAPDARALALLDAVIDAQARLVARWLSLGFVHGVMNTDNTAIGGETLDYGPCAFLDAYDPSRFFSAIDRRGRYAFRAQPAIAHWNLTRLAETLLPCLAGDEAQAVARAEASLARFAPAFEAAHLAHLRAKLGLAEPRDGDAALIEDLFAAMAAGKADFTATFRGLATLAEGGPDDVAPLFEPNAAWAPWRARWEARLREEACPPVERARAMRAVSPAFIPRNHQVEALLAAAAEGDLGPFERMLRVLARPYDAQPDAADLAAPPGPEQWRHRTFCGT